MYPRLLTLVIITHLSFNQISLQFNANSSFIDSFTHKLNSFLSYIYIPDQIYPICSLKNIHLNIDELSPNDLNLTAVDNKL